MKVFFPTWQVLTRHTVHVLLNEAGPTDSGASPHGDQAGADPGGCTDTGLPLQDEGTGTEKCDVSTAQIPGTREK